MTNTDKKEILDAIKGLGTKMDKRFLSIDKRLSNLENDMRKVLKCVDHENADFNPVTGFNGNRSIKKSA